MICCPICNSSKINLWGNKNNYKIYNCIDCTHIFADLSSNLTVPLNSLEENDFRSIITNNIMNSDDAYYRHLFSGEKEGFHTHITFNIIDKLIQLYNFNGAKTWLDVGCGSGFIVKQMSDRGWNAIGVEPGEWGQIAARERKINVVKGFLTTETFTTKFDVISATDVLEHQSNPYEFINLMKYYLKPEGLLVLSLPFADSLFAKVFKSKWSMIAPPTHCQFFTNKSLNILASKTEFRILNKYKYNTTGVRFLSRSKLFNKGLNLFFQLTNLGDQAVFVLKLKDKN